MIRRSTLIAVEILLGLVAALAIGVGVAWWRLSQGPIELSFLREQMQSELSAARGGRPVGLERVELAWSQRNALELRAVNVTVEDGRGGVLSRADEARIELAVLPLVIGRIQLVRAEFVGGELTFTRKLDGAMHIAFGPEGAPPDLIIPASPTNEPLERRVARWLDGMEAAFRPVGPGGGLRALSVRGARLAVIDEAGGGRWTAQGANLELSRQRSALELFAEARLEGAEGLAPASLRITTDTQFRSAVVEFGARDVRPRALFSPAALGPFAGLDAPLTATVSIGLDREAGINRFEGDAVLGQGTADAGVGQRFSLDGGRFHGRYDIASDELIIDQLALAGDTTQIGGEIRVRNVSAIIRAAPNDPATFNVSLPSLTLDVPGTLSQPAAFTNVEIAGAIASAERTVRFTRIHAETGQGVLDASGRIYWAEAGADRRLRPGIELNGHLDGAVEARAVLAMWPIGLGEGARDYLARSLTGGRVSDAIVHIDVRPSDIAAGVLRDEAMDIRFNVADASMRFVPTMSPVTHARGSAVLRGNRFDMTIPEARFHNMIVTNGRVELPQLKPKGAMATISARIDGDARHLLEVLGQEPISLGERLPIAAASAGGRGALNIRIQRPMLREAPFETWRFNIDGAIRDFSGAMTGRRMAISHGQLQVRGDHRAITVSGPIRAGTSAIEEVRWTEHIGRAGRASSEYQISGDFDADDLERLGYPVARYAQGRIGVTVSGQGRGFDVDNARIELDLTNAAVEAPRSFWTKRAGQAASARFTVERQRDGGLAFTNIDARGAGLNTQGRARLARDNRLVELDLTRFAIEGRSDARVVATRAADNGLDVSVRGALFDAAPFMGGEDAPPEADVRTAASVSPAAPLRASVIVDRLKLHGGATLSDARVALTTSRGALAMLTAEGRAPNGGAFSLGLGPRPGEPQGRIRLRSEDAGFAVAALTGADNIIGGSAAADGDWRTGPPSQARFDVRLRDFHVVRLPAMARLLSSAGSLTGLVEMLNGDGISFTALDAQMAYANNRLTFTDARMAGPSMGLTGSGAYNISADDLDIDGVVAPSPLLNLSMLGEVPVIGDLLVSRRGEGVFGMTYSINGPAAQPRVGVNPVSALTPGILRRIFEPVR
ncbi:MAG: hypothetical protein H7124_13370, partial [Phycisphaerales bacterium]|nr:hypothetical protein [Hyphomonadaceae bacterium]